ncbi:hypothetical protein P4O66_013142, partial [Electrophorus voltai]
SFPTKLLIIVIYRPPGSLVHFIDELDILLSQFPIEGNPLILLGDFNHPSDKLHSSCILPLLTAFDLTLNHSPSTHKAGNVPDLIFTHNTTTLDISYPHEILQLLTSSSLTTCPLDPIPFALFQTIARDLLPFISVIINNSLSSGYVPTAFKTARVVPILKKATFDSSNNQLHDPNQSDYKLAHSTEMAFIAVTEKLHAAKAAKLSSVLILLDLSAAFDTVNHDILLSSLSRLGVTGSAWRWFQSYLEGRSYQVSRRISACLTDIASWMTAHHLKLNPSKTELLFIPGPPNPHHDLTVSFENSLVSPSEAARSLGRTLDNQLSFKGLKKGQCSRHIYITTNLTTTDLTTTALITTDLTTTDPITTDLTTIDPITTDPITIDLITTDLTTTITTTDLTITDLTTTDPITTDLTTTDPITTDLTTTDLTTTDPNTTDLITTDLTTTDPITTYPITTDLTTTDPCQHLSSANIIYKHRAPYEI